MNASGQPDFNAGERLREVVSEYIREYNETNNLKRGMAGFMNMDQLARDLGYNHQESLRSFFYKGNGITLDKIIPIIDHLGITLTDFVMGPKPTIQRRVTMLEIRMDEIENKVLGTGEE